jgi:hypothetical protein
MKKSYFSFIILFLASQPCFSQITSQLIFDFNKGGFVENDYFKRGKIKPQLTGGFAILKIINVNTFRWKVEIEGRSINYITPIPSELQTIFRLPDQSINIQKAEKGIQSVQEADNLMQSLSTKINQDNVTSDSFKEAMTDLVAACKEYVEIAQEIANIKFVRAELINLSKQKWESYSAMDEKRPASLSYSDMKGTYEKFSKYYAEAEVKYYKSREEAANNLKEVKLSKPDPVSKPSELGESANRGQAEAYRKAQNDYEEYLKTKNKYDDREEEANQHIKDINKAIEKIHNGHDNIYEDNFLKLVQDVIVLQDAMENPTYFEVVSPPIQIDGDYVDFNIKTTPTKMNDLMPYDFGKTFPVEIPAKGGLKVDFSVGPTFSFGNNARDDKYYFTPGKDSTLQKLNNNNAISPGIAAMMHFYGRRGKNVNYGGLFGLGAGFQTVQDPNLSFYLGGSIIFGKREKLMLNAGVSYLSVDRLKTNQFVEGKQYNTSKVNIADLTEKTILPSFFFGISYNLTNRIEVK